MGKPHITIPPHVAKRPYLFWRKVDQRSTQECWKWKGTISQYGYGTAIRQAAKVRAKFQAHRLAYFLHYGVDPKDLNVLHRCDNPPCCNPNHLFLGTILDNARDMWEKGRQNVCPPPTKRGADHGCAKLTEAKVIAIRAAYIPFVKTQKMLARDYGVSVRLIDRILRRDLWKHI